MSESDQESLEEAAEIGSNLVLNTPVLHQGECVPSHILVTARLIDRITDKALEGIDDYDGDETKAEAAEAWIGRFATGELFDQGLEVSGWLTHSHFLRK